MVERLRVWREKTAPLFEPKSAMGAALRYMNNQWSRLTAFLGDALVPIHNNARLTTSAARVHCEPDLGAVLGPLVGDRCKRAFRARPTAQSTARVETIDLMSSTLDAGPVHLQTLGDFAGLRDSAGTPNAKSDGPSRS